MKMMMMKIALTLLMVLPSCRTQIAEVVTTTELMNHIQTLNATVTQLQNNNAILMGMVSSVYGQANSVMVDMSALKDESSILMTQIGSLKTQISSYEAMKTVVFSAYMTGGHNYPALHSKISFLGVATNPGGHFTTTKSEFTCPKRGFYYFSFSVYGSSMAAPKRSMAALFVNNNHVAEVYSRNTEGTLSATGSKRVIVDCPTGGKVYLKSTYSSNALWGHASERLTTFSGFLLTYT